MSFSLEMSNGLNYYFTVLFVFLGAYWMAYVFKNLTYLFISLGKIKFVILMSFFFALIAVLGSNIEAAQDYWMTGAYLSGFMLRFLRNDH